MFDKSLKYFICGSVVLIAALLGVMFFSPLSLQFTSSNLNYDPLCVDKVNRLMSAQEALSIVDRQIAQKSENLPHWPYFDRFLSQQDRSDAAIARADIYELQWKRIELLEIMNETEKLRDALEAYSKIIGYNQDKAISMLDRLREN